MQITTSAGHDPLYLLTPVGSAGDVLPFVAIGQRLAARGRRVAIATNQYFEPVISRAGLAFHELGTAEEYLQTTSDPDLWHPRRGFKAVMRHTAGPLVSKTVNVIRELAGQSPLVLVSSTVAFGARCAQELLGVPHVSVHLSPSCIQTAYDTATYPGLSLLRRAPLPMRRFFMHTLNRLIIDRTIGPMLNSSRAELGLPPVRDIMLRWMHSPDRVIGLWPANFCAIQPDWPNQVRLTTFPLSDASGLEPLPDELIRFMSNGEPPIVFTPGSANAHAADFFRTSVEVCRRLNRRGLFLSRLTKAMPKLPEFIRHFDYAPFGQVFPQAAAVVHHGGIGTTAQCLAAGVPQFITWMSHDQPDNAARATHLSAVASLNAARYTLRRVIHMIAPLLEGSARQHCQPMAKQLQSVDPLNETCDLIEKAGTRRNSAFSATS